MNKAEIMVMYWEDIGCSNDLTITERIPAKIWERQEITDELNKEFENHFEKNSYCTHFIAVWDQHGDVVKTCCSSMDDEYNLYSLLSFWRLIKG